MKFTRIELKNWKNFTHADVELRGRMFVVGANASGKSNFLEAFRFLRDLALPGGGLAEAVRLRGGMKAVRSVHARRDPEVMIRVEAELAEGQRWTYELAFTARKQGGTPIVVREVVTRHGEGGNGRGAGVLLARPDEEDQRDPERLTQTALEQTIANREFRELAEFFRSVRYLHLVPQLVREGTPRPDAVLGEDTMGRDLLERIRSAPKRQRDARLGRIGKVLEIAAPGLKSLELHEDEQRRPHLRVRFEHWRPTGAFQDETQFSDGTLRLVGMLWSLQERAGPLLLEEPELSLHGALMARLAPFIHRARKAAGDRQVILSTHSEQLLLDPGIAPEEVLLVRAGNEGSTITQASRSEAVRAMLDATSGSMAEAVLPLTRASQLELFDRVAP